ncbi:hypothetical protein ACQ4PT_041326 [Festuca glaucescens]
MACPYMIESPQLRWAFIRKVYVIVSMQLLATITVASTVYLVPDIRRFFLARTPAALASFVLIIVAPIIVMIPMMCLRNRHPINLILLALFTICMSFSVGLGCLSSKGGVIIEAALLAFVVVLSLTIYTFWAAKRGHDFSFLGPFLFAACLILMLYGLIQFIMGMSSGWLVGQAIQLHVSLLTIDGVNCIALGDKGQDAPTSRAAVDGAVSSAVGVAKVPSRGQDKMATEDFAGIGDKRLATVRK